MLLVTAFRDGHANCDDDAGNLQTAPPLDGLIANDDLMEIRLHHKRLRVIMGSGIYTRIKPAVR